MNIALYLQRAALRGANSPAVFHGKDLLWTYGELHGLCQRMAYRFRHELNLVPGTRVAIFMENTPAYLPMLFGAWYAGLVVVPVNAKLHPIELRYIVEDSEAAVLCTSPAFEAEVRRAGLDGVTHLMMVDAHVLGSGEDGDPLPVCARLDTDLAWLFYTSGTTGRPKGVMLSHANLAAATACYFSGVDSVDPGDAMLYAAPLSHGAGLYALPFILRGARHVLPPSGGFDPAEILDLSLHHGNLSMFAAPTMVKRLVAHIERSGADPGGFKTIVYGGGPMYVADIRNAIDVMGLRFAQIYGQGESPMTITSLAKSDLRDVGHARYEHRLASVGSAQALVEVEVHDACGNPVPAGTSGEVAVRGATVMSGYWNQHEATAQALRGGWLHTGDLGYMDEDGYLTLQDRSKDVVISGGTNIYPREVEEVLLAHPAVCEASVIGAPHPDWGEQVVAFIVLDPGRPTDAEALDAWCIDHIARFKRPKSYHFVGSLPKNSYGKVLKTELRQRLAHAAAS